MASELKVNKITPESGLTLTLGDSGDTINFGSGVLPNFENLTVTGDLTVDTNSLKVDSTNNFVGIGTASPTVALDVVGAITATGNITGTLATAAQPNITSLGTLTGLTTTGDINFGDNDKAQFGASQDLQIYHNGSESFINETGTGRLFIGAENQLILSNANNSEFYLRGTHNGALDLYYDNGIKLSTTSTGIDVTGKTTTDSIDAVGSQSGSTPIVKIENSVGDNLVSFKRTTGTPSDEYAIGADSASLHFKNSTLSTYIMSLSEGGDISFYEDTGTTPKLFWDASAESLGIGTSSPNNPLEINTTSTGDALRIDTTTATTNAISGNALSIFTRTSGTAAAGLGTKIAFITENSNGTLYSTADIGAATESSSAADKDGYLFFSTAKDSTNATERMRIDSSGNVGIGTTSPNQKLTVAGNIEIYRDDVDGYIWFHDFGTRSWALGHDVTNGAFVINSSSDLTANNTFAIATNGNVGIGDNTPLDKLHIYEASNSATATQLLLQNEGAASHSAGIAFQVSDSSETTGFAPKAGIIFERTLPNGRGPIKFFNDVVNDTNGFSAGDEVMRIDSSGNVGIGTSSPSAKLDVNGITRTANAYSISYSGVPGSTSAFGAGTISADSNWGMYFRATTGAAIADFAWVNGAGTERMRIDTSGHLLPATTNTYDLGSSSLVWRNIYTSDFHMSNEGLDKGNDIDGTKGSWTFQEGEENLYLINNKNGKKYKFNLTEVA